MRSCRSPRAAPKPTTFPPRRSIASSSSGTRRTISNAHASAGARSIAVATGGYTVRAAARVRRRRRAAGSIRHRGGARLVGVIAARSERSPMAVAGLRHVAASERPKAVWLTTRRCTPSSRRPRWRKRLGVEPSLPRKGAATDFEDREGHRAPFTSVVDHNVASGAARRINPRGRSNTRTAAAFRTA